LHKPCILQNKIVYYDRVRKEDIAMLKRKILDKLSIYIPQGKMKEKPVQRLIKLSNKKDCSINYLVVEAIMEYLKREEGK